MDHEEARARVDVDLGKILEKIRKGLAKAGVEVELTGSASASAGEGTGARVKVVCVPSGVRESVEEMNQTARDQVVMVRVDQETSEALDSWVETGAVKSRSEAAALFIREGLNVRKDELERLREALRDVEEARARLREQAKQVFGGGGDWSGDGAGDSAGESRGASPGDTGSSVSSE